MPLPDAEPPEKSRLYEELKSKTALPGASGAVTADLLDNLKNATFLDAENEDQLRRLVLLMQATGAGSITGPMPNTGEFVTKTKTDSSGTLEMWDGSEHIGEVWKLVSAGVDPNNTNIRVRFRLYNIANTIQIELGDETGHGSDEPFNPTATWGGDFTIDQNTQLRAYVDGMAAGRSVDVKIYMIRVR